MGCDLGREIDRTEVTKTVVLGRSGSHRHCERSWATRVAYVTQDPCEDAQMLPGADTARKPAAGLADPSADGESPAGHPEAPPAGRRLSSSSLRQRAAKAVARQRSRSAPKAAAEPLERFAESLNFSSLPLITFSEDVDEMRVWHYGSVTRGEVQLPKRNPDLRIRDPIAMSPAYLGFAVEPYAPRFLQYDGVGILFARPAGGVFMQPSIDTVLLCCGLQRLFSEEGSGFQCAVDIGSGSGFVGKFAAVHAPGSGDLSVTLCDVDPAALKYSRSPGFGAPSSGFDGRPVSFERHAGDATLLLRKESKSFDLLISNPPYIPTHEEVVKGQLSRPSATAGHKSFWEGVGLVVFLIEHFAARSCPPKAHMVLVLTSLTLKAPDVLKALEAADSAGVRCRCLLEREVAWKAWYAGPHGHDFLLATNAELRQRKKVGKDLEVFVGATQPGRGRLQKVADGRQRCQSYHWHVVYVLDFSFS